MTRFKTTRLGLVVAGLTLGALAGGVVIGRATAPPETAAPAVASGRKVLYWYDPMVPGQRFERPGKSPYMDMPLQPKYADEGAAIGVTIDSAQTQSLGVRLATVHRGLLPGSVSVPGVIDFNERDVAVVQAKASGFVQRVYGRAPGDVVAAGAPLADILVPEWAGAQAEFLAVRRGGDPALIRASRQRLALLGMPPAVISTVEHSGRVRDVATITTPVGGAIRTLSVRNGMTVTAGQTLAEVNGLSRVWVNAAVPEAMTGEVRVGQVASASLAAFPGETFGGRVTAILPQAQAESRTLTARIELPNAGGRLRPGMFATVRFAGASQPALLVPSEAVIRTGRRTLVMLAGVRGTFQPAEIRAGREAGGQTEVLAGLSEGEQVVASGQFLLDSEASLSGLAARPVGRPSPARTAPPLVEGVGRVEQITGTQVTLSHDAIPALQWPAMTMSFRLADPHLAHAVKPGERVGFALEQTAEGPLVRRLERRPGR
jgi:Cu(I)/Ag(I) efflux system membrane fusion protein